MRGLSTKAAFLCASGACALVYQTMWLRELRTVFGASTPANAAVLAVFMGGLGLGSALFGRRAQRSTSPLRLYAHLELGVAVSAAVSPFLVDVTRALYLAIGGSSTLGGAGATVLRLVLSAVALGVPALLMGGTFPAMARASYASTDATESAHDSRKQLALLYGANTIGAVIGASSSTFALLSIYGVRKSLWIACAINALVAMIARSLSRSENERVSVDASPLRASPASAVSNTPSVAATATRVPRAFVLACAFATGFAFLLLELVWYRLSAPLLGGSTYSFGLVLATALFGVGAGGFAYAFFGPARASVAGFAITCALEAVCVLVPYGFGDDVARLAFFLRDLGEADLSTLIAGWTVVTAILVLPAALVAGWQFPSLLALAGDGAHDAARDSGDVYAANTLGSIAGSLAGGFGFLPWLSAPGAWKLAAFVLALAAVAAVAVSVARELPREWPREWPRRAVRIGCAAVCVVVAGALATADGPTAVWRHHGIGAGRGKLRASSWNQRMEREMAARHLIEDHEGVESSLGFQAALGSSALIVNGKSDGSTRGDAQTQVGLSLLPALVHGHVTSAFVVGLGTGESAGWLADVKSVTRVDVAEIEPAVQLFVRRAASANRHVLENPKVHVVVGDGREALATSTETYDLIVAEPSNPYRSGVAGFYTRDFYGSVKKKLKPGGIYAQWLQAYEIEASAIQIAVATAADTFTDVSAWRLESGDMLLLCRDTHAPVDVERMRAQLDEEPFATFEKRILRSNGTDGIFARAIANDAFLRAFASTAPLINSDDEPALEMSFAQSVGRDLDNRLDEMLTLAHARSEVLPATTELIDDAALAPLRGRAWTAAARQPPSSVSNDALETAWGAANAGEAARLLADDPARDDFGKLVRLHVRITTLDPSAGNARDEEDGLAQEIDDVAHAGYPTEAAFLRLELAISMRDVDAVIAHTDAFDLLDDDPFVPARLPTSAIARLLALELPDDKALAVAEKLARPGRSPFEHAWRTPTAHALLAAHAKSPPAWCIDIYAPVEPAPLWNKSWLGWRASCYRAVDGNSPRAIRAQADVDAFAAHEPSTIEALLPAPAPNVAPNPTP